MKANILLLTYNIEILFYHVEHNCPIKSPDNKECYKLGNCFGDEGNGSNFNKWWTNTAHNMPSGVKLHIY